MTEVNLLDSIKASFGCIGEEIKRRSEYDVFVSSLKHLDNLNNKKVYLKRGIYVISDVLVLENTSLYGEGIINGDIKLIGDSCILSGIRVNGSVYVESNSCMIDIPYCDQCIINVNVFSTVNILNCLCITNKSDVIITSNIIRSKAIRNYGIWMIDKLITDIVYVEGGVVSASCVYINNEFEYNKKFKENKYDN